MRTSWLAAAAVALTLAAPARAALTPEEEGDLDRAVHELYNLDYTASRADFRKIIEVDPDNPFGYLFEAAGIWWQASQEYGLFKDTPTLQGLFEEDVDAAIRKGDAWTNSHDREQRADGHFVMGMALGTRGQWSLMKGQWLAAWSDGKKAVKHLRKCEKLDPDYHDAELGLGVFEYQAAQLSGIVKLGAMLGGMRGDAAGGIARIRDASQSGRYARRQAEEFLSSIYFDDQRDYASALPLLIHLRTEFPESVYFDFLTAVAQDRVGDLSGSIDTARAAFAKIASDPAAYDRKLLSLVCGSAGPVCLSPAMTQRLGTWLDAAIAADEAVDPPPQRPKARHSRRRKAATVAPEELAREQRLSLLHLYRGFAADARGLRPAAQADYRWVLAHPDFADDAARAQECLDAPCNVGVLLRRLHAMSQGDLPEPADPPAR